MMEVKEILKELIDEEVITFAVREAVQEKFNYYVEKEIKDKIHECIDGKLDEYIKPEIEKVMLNQVRVDDGWGHTQEYGSFDNYVRNQISKGLRDSWKIDEKIRSAVNARLKKYIDDAVKSKMEDRTDMVLTAMAEDILQTKQI